AALSTAASKEKYPRYFSGNEPPFRPFWALRPTTAFAWTLEGFPRGATRWRFEKSSDGRVGGRDGGLGRTFGAIPVSADATTDLAVNSSRRCVPDARLRTSGDPRLGTPSREVDKPPEDAVAVGAQAVVLELVGDPRAQSLDQRCGLHGELALDIEIVDVDCRRDRHLVLAKAIGVVELRPLVLGKEVGRRPVQTQRRVVLPHPREDVLGREIAVLLDRRRQEAGRRPAGREAVGVGRLVEGGVERVPSEASAILRVVQECWRAER